MRRAILTLACLSLLLLAGCAAQPQQRLTVFAAASLTESFKEIGAAFSSQHPQVQVDFNFAGSQTLLQQIASGAPADVFASADVAQMNAAVDSGHVTAGSQAVIVHNHLVLVVSRQAQGNIQSLLDLAKPGTRLVLAAKEVPVGNYSIQCLQKASQDPAFGTKFSEHVLANVQSYEENVKAVLTKVALGEADAGIVYHSDAPEDTDAIRVLEIPATYNMIADYYLAPMQDAKQADLAKEFMAFVLSSDGQDILKKYGFLPATGERKKAGKLSSDG